MNKKINFIILTVLSAGLLLIFPSGLAAESLFLKDGTVTEGTVSSETDKIIKFKTADGKVREFRRGDVIRILHHSDFKQKKFIYKTDGSLIEAYIVDEDKLTYTYRAELNSVVESKILKSDIDTISRKKISFASEEKEKVMTRQDEILSRASRLRLGLAGGGKFGYISYPEVMDSFTNTDDMESMSLNLDLFALRIRTPESNGFDFFLRGMLATFENENYPGSVADYVNPALVNNYFGYIIPEAGNTVIRIKWDQLALGAGLRYIHGWYKLGILWQGYLMGYYQYSSLEVTVEAADTYPVTNEFDNTIYDSSHGLAGGVGIEAALFANFGIFAEFTTGYSSAFETGKNIEQSIIRFGIILRTSHL